ncbi:hydroxyacid dehydrogenase [Arenibaculum pallidiluteum]|uniref:hydroxyacid dehydrogenase n=1 Tax=Arenibaculum pallidiluteum TaxID=2812559 RepID=UPI001A96CBEF|nr:hydroxyacid dehydrogenase [Arenibaculum pallidiluteum]
MSARPTRTCLIAQPIHPAGERRLADAGITVLRAPDPRAETLLGLVGQADAAITRNAGMAGAVMEAAPGLCVIANHGVGVDRLDVAAATRLGIPVCNTPGANTVSVAEHAIALMLALAKQIVPGDAAARRGDFDIRYRARFTELAGKRLGIVGFGMIGQATARIAGAGLGMAIDVYSPSADPLRVAALGGRKLDSLDELLAESDVVSLHLPSRPETRGLIGRRALSLMKPSALLVNTGRGEAVDETALAEALAERRIAGAALDVFVQEPLPEGHPFRGLDTILLSPHTASSTEECLERMALTVADQVIRTLAGMEPPHLLNPEIWGTRRLPSR